MLYSNYEKIKSLDEAYISIILDALGVCKNYKPKFGRGAKAGFSLSEFQALYQQDDFYTWFGLDSPLVYAAHKAAGGMTSVYRQIGIACERLFRRILQDTLSIEAEQTSWSYQVPSAGGKARTLSLDGRISLLEIQNQERRAIAKKWLSEAASNLRVDREMARQLRGAVFEIRQGYKSKDSKRQNADIGNAVNAYTNLYLPVLGLLSVQIDSDIEERYTRAQWLILKGSLHGASINSIYVFCRDVLGYDLAGFFKKNSPKIQTEVESIIQALLK